MDELKQVKPIALVSWPSPQDYNEAVQNPELSFSDSGLGSAIAETDSFGIPRPNTGMFASVYKMHCSDGDWALRCFLHFVPDQVERYQAISEVLSKANLSCTLRFELQERGIRIHGTWYPVLKMQWCEGETLDGWLSKNLYDAEVLDNFLSEWKKVLSSFVELGIAHGDLQHGNVLINGGRVKVVDYDGMYVPSLQGRLSNELGHRDYQHPGRTQENYGPGLDNFSAWVIYLSVLILKFDPQLWDEFDGGLDRLIFKQSDFEQPLHSPTFHILENHAQDDVRVAARSLRYLLSLSPEQVPPLGETILVPASMPELLEPHYLCRSQEDFDKANSASSIAGGDQDANDLDMGPLYHSKKRQRSRLKGGASGWRRFAPALEEEPPPNIVSAEMLSPLAQLVRRVADQSDQGQSQGNSAAASVGMNSPVVNVISSASPVQSNASQSVFSPPAQLQSARSTTIWQSLWKKMAIVVAGVLGTVLLIGVTISQSAWHEPQVPVLEKGNEYLHAQKYAEAAHEFQNVIDTLQKEKLEKTGDSSFNWRKCTEAQVWAHEKLGSVQFEEKSYEDALDNFYKAGALFQQIKPGDSPELAHILKLKGHASEAMNRISNASSCYRDAVTMYERLGEHPFTNRDMAECLSAQSRNALAERHD